MRMCIIMLLDSAGPDPVAAITMLVRLRLFPAVFPAPSPATEALGSDYGAPCLAAMSAAHALLQVRYLICGDDASRANALRCHDSMYVLHVSLHPQLPQSECVRQCGCSCASTARALALPQYLLHPSHEQAITRCQRARRMRRRRKKSGSRTWRPSCCPCGAAPRPTRRGGSRWRRTL